MAWGHRDAEPHGALLPAHTFGAGWRGHVRVTQTWSVTFEAMYTGGSGGQQALSEEDAVWTCRMTVAGGTAQGELARTFRPWAFSLSQGAIRASASMPVALRAFWLHQRRAAAWAEFSCEALASAGLSLAGRQASVPRGSLLPSEGQIKEELPCETKVWRSAW